jgi:hypothetical protein
MTPIYSLLLGIVCGQPSVDVSAYRPTSGVAVRQDGTKLHLRWPITKEEYGVLVVQMRDDAPLIEEMGLAKFADGASVAILRKVNPVTFLTVGTRDLSAQGWNVFFDNPPRRPHETFPAVLKREKVRVESQGRRATVIVDGLTAGLFRGKLLFTVYPGCALVHTEAVVQTEKNACAILYDAGLASATPSWKWLAWLDTSDRWQRVDTTSQVNDARATVVSSRDVAGVERLATRVAWLRGMNTANLSSNTKTRRPTQFALRKAP